MADKNRIVMSLLDMDCFYVQVERQKNPSLVNKPVVLCQHGSGNSIVLSISYEARKFGIKRSMTVKEAKEACPNLEVVFVPAMQTLDKGDLTCYKEASESIFDVILDYCGENVVIEKASVDEAYFDLTKEIDRILQDDNFKAMLKHPDEKLPEFMSSSYSVYSHGKDDFETSDRIECLKRYVDVCMKSEQDMALLAGTYFMEGLRKEIFEKTNYHCSAGIATNKMLAKLVASRHKPKAQTVLPQSEAISYISTQKIQSIRWFGGKFGIRLTRELDITDVGEIHDVSIEKLKRIFPDDYLRIVNLANGVCHEPVVQRIMPKSLGVTKKLYNTNGDQILIWTKGLATELVRRLETDQDKFSRTAQHIEFSASLAGEIRAHVHGSFNILFYNLDTIFEHVKKLFVKHYGTEDESKWYQGVSHMTFNATKFGPLRTKVLSIQEFFKPKDASDLDCDDIAVIYSKPKVPKRPNNDADTMPVAAKRQRMETLSNKTLTNSSQTSKKKEVESMEDKKQSRLNFSMTSVGIKSKTAAIETIELSSDDNDEKPTSSR